MFMHMPKKLGIPVMVIVAACLAAYWWFVVAPVRVGDWEIYQGTGREDIAPDIGSISTPCVEISYTVRNPRKPLFGLRPEWHTSGLMEGAWIIRIRCRSELPAILRAVVHEEGGAAFEARLDLEGSDAWQNISLGPEQFVPTSDSRARLGVRHPNFRRLRSGMDFYDGSDAPQGFQRLSNRLWMQDIDFSLAN